MMKRFLVITLLPDVVRLTLNSSMMWKAQKDGLVEFDILDLREFGIGPRRQVDDKPFGGGAGMLLMIEPLLDALAEAKRRLPNAKVLIMTPTDYVWDQVKAAEYANSDDDYILICGRYEGFDARIFEYVDQKISIGHYVLTGGELPALSIIDSIVRLLPGVLGGGTEASAIESYSDNESIEYPQYTRPAEYDGRVVPEVLLSGNHALIDKWRQENFQ